MRPLLLLLVAITYSCISNNRYSNPSDPYSFLIAGHTYGQTGVHNKGVHPAFKEKFELIRQDELIKFGVFTGDIVIVGNKKTWGYIDADIAALGKPVYFAVGNHDIMANPKLYNSLYGPTYFSFKKKGDLFIILDPNLDSWNISGKQLAFLKEELANNYLTVDNIFVFFHQLLWWENKNIYRKYQPNSRSGKAKNINFWNEIEPLFNNLPNPVFMMAGDIGAFPNKKVCMYHQYDNITLIASGMGGGVKDNFVIVDVHEDKSVSFRLIALNGNDIHALGRLEDHSPK